MFRELSRDHLLLRYDDRGNGLSDWDTEDISFDAWVRDLETVVDVVGLQRFALLGISRGAAVSIEYAARHPERVSHLILLGGFYQGANARTTGREAEIRQAMLTLMREGWGQDNPAFRQLWTSIFVPDGTVEQQHWFNELQRNTTSPSNAVRMQQASDQVDVSHRLVALQVPTLVCHAEGDAVVKFDHGRRMAAAIPRATFVPLTTRNHLLLEHEPAFRVFLTEFRRFLGTAAASEAEPGDLTLEPAAFSPGTSVGHYRIEARIGSGGMGVVYRAKDTKLRRDVALKVLSVSKTTDDRNRSLLLREARHAARLNHPNICTVYEVKQIGDCDLIVMELVPGRTLSALLAGGPAPLESLLSIGAQIADALDHAHDRGVIHGDLKSGNVIVSDDGRLKVLDFGVARRTPGGDSDMTTETSPDSQGRIGGTPAYMAPELLRGDITDARSDLWSLGVLLCQLATGQLPFVGANLYALMTDILQNKPALPASVPPALALVIRHCLQKDPSARYQRGADVRDALRAL
jgi:pimeloyl-ACP methyl ester carboxylesterase